ncbi:MAG: nuclear transport factor 2 family protein [Pyrinomonadaceae bacterium]
MTTSQKQETVTKTKIVAEIYKHFSEGNVPAILELMAEDIHWEYSGGTPGVPWLTESKGRESTIAFFESLSAIEFIKFEPKEILEGNDVVVGLLDVEFKVNATGKTIREIDETHIFKFDSDNKVCGFRHGVDSYKHWEAQW